MIIVMLSKGQHKTMGWKQAIEYLSTTKKNQWPKDFGTKNQSSVKQCFLQDVSVEK